MSPAFDKKRFHQNVTHQKDGNGNCLASTATHDKPVFSPVFILATLASVTSQRNDNRLENKTTMTNAACQRRMMLSAVIILVVVLQSLEPFMDRRWVGLARLVCVTVTCRKKATHTKPHLLKQWELVEMPWVNDYVHSSTVHRGCGSSASAQMCRGKPQYNVHLLLCA